MECRCLLQADEVESPDPSQHPDLQRQFKGDHSLNPERVGRQARLASLSQFHVLPQPLESYPSEKLYVTVLPIDGEDCGIAQCTTGFATCLEPQVCR